MSFIFSRSVLDVHDMPITRVRMSACGQMIATSGGRYIRIFHNVAEFFGNVVSLEKAIHEAREEGKRRRLREQLVEARKLLESFAVN